MDYRAGRSVRILAPTALIASLVALLLAVATSLGGEDGRPTPRPPPAAGSPAEKASAGGGSRRPGPAATVYVVRSGDTLGTIARRTGLSAERLQDLNPELGRQGLVSGQRIKLRE